MTTLNSKQQQSYNKVLQLARFLRKSKHIHSKVTPFHNEVAAFLHHLEDLPGQVALKAKKGMNITIQKRENKKEIARKAAHICNLATAFAISINDRDLKGYTNFTYTDIYTTKDSILRFRIASIITAVKPLLNNENFKGYKIKEEDLTTLSVITKQYTSSMHTARFLNRASEYASRTITATLKKLQANISQMNRLLVLFADEHPSFIQGFRQATATEQKTKNSNAIEGIIKDDSTHQPLQNVTITAEGNNKTAVTNASGFFHCKGIKRGTQTFIITAGVYTPQTITATVIRGKTITLNISLQAKQFSMPASEVA